MKEEVDVQGPYWYVVLSIYIYVVFTPLHGAYSDILHDHSTVLTLPSALN